MATRTDSKSDKFPPPLPLELQDPSGTVWHTGDRLGKGGFAMVYSAFNTGKPGQVVALKAVKSEMAPQIQDKFRSELGIHSKLNHEHIVKFVHAFAHADTSIIVMEICSNGTLKDMVEKRRALSLPEVRRFGIQISGAINYLHTRDVIHRDLKLGNIFLDANMNPKIGDFGLAAALMPDRRRITRCGTPNYMAPEIWTKDGNGHGKEVDLWALGCILFCMMTGKLPFFRKGDQAQLDIRRRAEAQEYDWPKAPTGGEFPTDAKDLIAMMLCKEDDRIKPDAVVTQSFFTADMGRVPVSTFVAQLTEKPAWRDSFNMKRASPSILAVDLIRASFGVPDKVSVWTICEKEEVSKRGPQLPLRPGVLYPSPSPTIRKIRTISHSTSSSTSLSQSFDTPKTSVFALTEPTSVLLERTDSALANLQQTVRTLSLSLKKLDPSISNVDERAELRSTPRVQNFADHGDKFGVGYILDDGTTGAILNYCQFPTSVIARDSAYTMKRFFESGSFRQPEDAVHLLKDSSPLALYERDATTRQLHYVEVSNLKSVLKKRHSTLRSDHFEREKGDRIRIWLKFAKWMALRFPIEPPRRRPEPSGAPSLNKAIVVLFQRLGNVIVWRFSNGVTQFVFEGDRSYIRLSPNGSYIEFMFHIMPDIATVGHRVGAHLDTPYVVLNGGAQGKYAETFARNKLESKLAFVYHVFKVWTINGGVGRMGGMNMRWNDDDGEKNDVWELVSMGDTR